MGSQFQWLTALHVLTFQHIPCLITGQFVSSLPYTSVTGIIGEGVVLPCHVAAEHIPEMFSVQWIFNEQLEKITVSRYDGKSKKEIQDERYRGRTEFFHSEFRAGNMSLHLRNVKNSDKGSYTCVVSFDNQYHDVLIELEVAARGGVPSIFLRSHVKQGISLTCHTEGWFPEPQVIWLDGRGQIRKELSTTKIMMMPAGLYSVATSMNLEQGSDMEVSCMIVNNLLNTTSESRVLISDVFFPSISKWLVVFLVILCLSMVLISSTFCKLRSNHKKTVKSKKEQLKSMLEREKTTNKTAKSILRERFDQLNAELDFWESQSHAVPITMNPDGQALELQVPGALDPKSNTTSESADLSAPSTVRILVGQGGFAAGKHYWEVEVPQQQDWVLGVVEEKGKHAAGGILPMEDYWALHRSQGELVSSEADVRIEKKLLDYSVIGVLLDLEERQVKFYEAVQMVLLVTIPISLGKEVAKRFYPFVPKRESTLKPFVLHPVRIPSVLEKL
nr:butyrophilin subfamily 3 member A2-like [Dromaius novaehollandiae]